MKVLHTADLHLEKIEDNKWLCLKRLIEIGKEQKIDAMVIAGDVLDKEVRYSDIRGQLGLLFSNLPFKIIMIRGNHDETNLDGQHFGDSTYYIKEIGEAVVYNQKTKEWGKTKFTEQEINKPEQLGETASTASESADLIAFWGLPYDESLSLSDILDVLQRMSKMAVRFGTNILLHHGVLIGAEINFDIEQEKHNFYKYMPIRKEYFKGTPFQYVLAGHIHSKFQAFALPNDGVYVYPGSPYPMKTTEKGPRSVNIFEVKKSPMPFTLDSPYNIDHVFKITPQHQSLQQLLQNDKIFQNLLKENCKIYVKLDGYFNGTLMNKEQNQLIEDFIVLMAGYGGKIIVKEDFAVNLRDISKITNSPIYGMFTQKVDEQRFDSNHSENIMRLFLKAMMESKIE